MSLPRIHRVVTGHDALGKAVVVIDGPLATLQAIAALPGTVFHDLWSTAATPAPPSETGADACWRDDTFCWLRPSPRPVRRPPGHWPPAGPPRRGAS